MSDKEGQATTTPSSSSNSSSSGLLLSHVLQQGKVVLGGCSFGVGLKKAAHYYIHGQQQQLKQLEHNLDEEDDVDDDDDDTVPPLPLEDSFFVVDVGVVVSQLYQWRRFFPRIEPFYAVKCNPDPIIIQTLATLGCHFDCASRQEVQLVQKLTQNFPLKPEIIYANPCKAAAHLRHAVRCGVRLVTFDNLAEVQKCAAVVDSRTKLQLVLRIVTDDRGSQCRFSSKFGAPRHMWRPLLAAAKQVGLPVVGVSFHVGSGCRNASKYMLALRDARYIFDLAKREFGYDMDLLDIGGGFPGETHSIWNPAVELDQDDDDTVEGTEASTCSSTDEKEGNKQHDKDEDDQQQEDESSGNRFMFFKEIAQAVAPVIDKLFPPSSGVRIIAEPGRYFVAAAATLCCSVVAVRNNTIAAAAAVAASAIDDRTAAQALNALTRQEECDLVVGHTTSSSAGGEPNACLLQDKIFSTIQSELRGYSKLFATQELTQQEFDVYNDPLDLYQEGYASAIDVLGPPEIDQLDKQHHTAEGMTAPLVAASTSSQQPRAVLGSTESSSLEQPPQKVSSWMALLSLAVAGEAAVSGVLAQAVADATTTTPDIYAYYINDGVYGAFNNLMFDHARVRPRVLSFYDSQQYGTVSIKDGFHQLTTTATNLDTANRDQSITTTTKNKDQKKRSLYSSTVFGPTCDSIDVISRSVLLPRLDVGDWMYFTNMGAYTIAAASSFNGFTPSERFYVCSVQPEYFEGMIKGPNHHATRTKSCCESSVTVQAADTIDASAKAEANFVAQQC